MKKQAIGIWLIILTFTFACQPDVKETPQFSSADISRVIAQMTDAMVHDVTNPPLAARFFAYASLAGYEVASRHDSTCQSLYGILNEYPEPEKPAVPGEYSWQLSALLAMMETAKKIQPSGNMIDAYEQNFLDSCRRNGFPEPVIINSLQYAQQVSGQILAYAKADKYNKISNYPRYSPLNTEGSWYPTPPAFFAPVEPYFNTIRPFTLDSCAQFKPEAPTAFSTDKNSEFFQLMNACYQEGRNLSEEHREIAAFWDCNPFALEDNGHMMVGKKKISPGAHWMGITGIACRQANVSFAEAMKIHTVVALGLTDAFISCWDEKFRSNRIRPETAIRKYLDPSWQPLLQTPPFPEYLSGHSVISSASAVILSHYFGDTFAYTDTVEVRYGLPERSFTSFHQAAEEAGLSRFYGGIHFMDAIEQGRNQGLQVGQWVIQHLEKNSRRLVYREPEAALQE
jgi:hypothetical protein